jgi:6-phosphogluconolactonase (cycloisomerase 2 family)
VLWRKNAVSAAAVVGYRLFDNRGNLRLLPQSPFDGVSDAYGLSLDLSNDFLYAANNSGNTISGFEVDPKSGDLLALTDSPYVAGKHPTSVTVVNNLQ